MRAALRIAQVGDEPGVVPLPCARCSHLEAELERERSRAGLLRNVVIRGMRLVLDAIDRFDEQEVQR